MSRMTELVYYVGRFLQLLAMSLLLMAIMTAGPLGPSPRVFGGGVAVFVVGWLMARPRREVVAAFKSARSSSRYRGD